MATEGTEHAAAGAAHGGEAVGMPQLDFSTWPNQIFWLAVALVAIFLILNRIALPRIAAVLAERSGTIVNDLAAAEELKARALEAEKSYNEALAAARAEAGKIAARARAEIQADLDAATAQADAQIAERTAASEATIAAIRAGALESVAEVATEVAAEIVSALGGKAEAKGVAAAVAARMKG
jgi:F-type H+-transporting ATPase subunit b